MRRRFLILEEAIINEFAEDYYFVCDSLTSFDLYMCNNLYRSWLQGGKPSSLNRALKNGLLNQRIHLFSAKFRLLTERALHEFASKNISRNLSAIGTYVNVNMEDEQVTEVIMLDDWFDENENTKNLEPKHMWLDLELLLFLFIIVWD